MLSQGVRTHFNYRIFSSPIGGALFRRYWVWRRGKIIEGINVGYAAAIAEAVRKIDPSIKILCTGGFQHAIEDRRRDPIGACDGVAIGRPLIANPNLPQMLKHRRRAAGRKRMHLLQQMPDQRPGEPARLL